MVFNWSCILYILYPKSEMSKRLYSCYFSPCWGEVAHRHGPKVQRCLGSASPPLSSLYNEELNSGKLSARPKEFRLEVDSLWTCVAMLPLGGMLYGQSKSKWRSLAGATNNRLMPQAAARTADEKVSHIMDFSPILARMSHVIIRFNLNLDYLTLLPASNTRTHHTQFRLKGHGQSWWDGTGGSGATNWLQLPLVSTAIIFRPLFRLKSDIACNAHKLSGVKNQ